MTNPLKERVQKQVDLKVRNYLFEQFKGKDLVDVGWNFMKGGAETEMYGVDGILVCTQVFNQSVYYSIQSSK